MSSRPIVKCSLHITHFEEVWLITFFTESVRGISDTNEVHIKKIMVRKGLYVADSDTKENLEF